MALVDEQYVRQVVINLLINAIEASAPGENIRLKSLVSSGSVMIEVSDEGPGVSPEHQEHLFEPFYTTKSNGHGLGPRAISRVGAEHGRFASLAKSSGARRNLHFALRKNGAE
jgi:polar amino acid transport system substrate-binding protein